MNFTSIFCCYILLPYFASLVSPPQEAITCNAIGGILEKVKEHMCFHGNRRTDIDSPENVNAGNTNSEKKPEIHGEEDNKDETPRGGLQDRYFQQKIDHYHFNNKTKWPQRYMINGEHYEGNGIIFIMFGDNMDITSNHMKSGLWMEYAKLQKALCIGIELRSYSEEFPLPKRFFRNNPNENLKYFNTEQTLADVAWFVHNIRNEIKKEFELPKKLKWISYGTGLQGSLATWFRVKFPHLVKGTLALGPRLLAKENYDLFYWYIHCNMLNWEIDFRHQLFLAYGDIYNSKMSWFWNIDSPSFYDLRTKQDEVPIENLRIGNLFRFCNKRILDDWKNKKNNLSLLYMTLAKAIALVMQFGNKNDYMESTKMEVRKIMFGEGEYEQFDKIERLRRLVLKVAGKPVTECLKIDYLEAISEYQKTKTKLYFPLPEIFGNRVSLYQKCTEYGQFEVLKLFGAPVNLDFYTNICNAVFGELSTPEVLEKGIRKTNVFYGGLDIEVANVIFIYGEKEPYRELGVYGKSVKNSVVLELEASRNYGELDYLKTSPTYPAVDAEIRNHLTTWLQSSEDIEYRDTENINKSDRSDNSDKNGN